MKTNGTHQQPTDIFAPWMMSHAPAFDMWMTVGRAFVQRSSEAMTDWSAFLVARLREDATLQQQLLTCSSPTDVQRALAAFSERAVEQYSREFTRFGQMASRLTADIAATVKTDMRNTP